MPYVESPTAHAVVACALAWSSASTKDRASSARALRDACEAFATEIGDGVPPLSRRDLMRYQARVAVLHEALCWLLGGARRSPPRTLREKCARLARLPTFEPEAPARRAAP